MINKIVITSPEAMVIYNLFAILRVFLAGLDT